MPHASTCLDCHAIVAYGETRCAACRSSSSARHNAETTFYRSRQWRRLRAIVTANGCCICGKTRGRIVAHHIKPRAEGGPDDLTNLAPLCGTHHNQVEADLKAGRRSLLTMQVEQYPTTL